MNDFQLVNNPSLNATAENYLTRKTTQLKPGKDKISNSQLATLYLRVKHGSDISAPKLFILKHFFRKDAWLNEAKIHVKQHNIQAAVLSVGSKRDTEISRKAAKLLLLNEKHLNGTALYVPPSNIESRKVDEIFIKLETILYHREKLEQLIPEDSALRIDLDDIEKLSLKNINEKSDSFNALFALAITSQAVVGKERNHLLKTLLNYYSDSLKSDKLENINKISQTYENILFHCPGAETLPDHIILQSLPIIDPDSYQFLQEQLKLSNSGVFKETLIKNHNFNEASFDKSFPNFHQTYLSLTKKGIPEVVIQLRFNEYLNLHNTLSKEKFLSNEAKLKFIDGTFGPFLEQILTEGKIESKIAPVQFLMKNIMSFHEKHPFFDEQLLVRVAQIHSREILLRPNQHFIQKYDNEGKFDALLFERALFSKALELAKNNPNFIENCQNAWAHDLTEALKNPTDLRNLIGKPIDPTNYIEALKPLFVGPPSHEEIMALKNIILAGEELLENTFHDDKSKSAPEIAKGCLSYLQELQMKHQTLKGPEAFLDAGKAEFLLPYCIPHMSPIDQWQKAFTEGFEDDMQFMNMAFHIKMEFNKHAETSPPLTSQELKNLQEIVKTGLNLVNEDHYAIESVGKGCYQYFAEQRKNLKLVESPSSLLERGKSEELLPYCYGHLMPFEGWQEQYMSFIGEKYGKSDIDQQFAATLVQKLEASSLGPVNDKEFEVLKSIMSKGSEFIQRNKYPPDVVATGICRYLQQFRDRRVTLQSPNSYDSLTTYCFDALIESGIGDQPDKLNDALFLFRKIKNRQMPLTTDGQERLKCLLEISLDPAFALGKGLSDPLVKAKFKTILNDLDCADISSLNNHEYPLETLAKAFIEHQESLHQMMNLGDLTIAITENPTRCASELLQPIVTTLVGRGDQKTIRSINKNIDHVLDNLSEHESSAALAERMNQQLSKISKIGPITQALEVGVEVSSKDLIKILLGEIAEIRSQAPDEERTGAIGTLLSKLIPLFVNAQEERRDPGFSIFSIDASPIATFLPKFHKSYSHIKAGGSIVEVLDFVSPKFISKIVSKQIIPEIAPKIINYALKKETKKLEKILIEQQKYTDDPDDPVIQGLNKQIDLLKILRANSKEISAIAIKLATVITDRHDLNRHEPLLDYLNELGSEKVKDVDTQKLEGLLLDSIEIILKESNFYVGGLESLIDAVQQLPQHSVIPPNLETPISIKQKPVIEKPLTQEEEANMIKWKEEITKATNEKYNKGSASSHLAERLVNEAPNSLFIQSYNPERLREMVSILGIGSSIMGKLQYSEDAVLIGCRRFFEQQLIDPGLRAPERLFFISDNDREKLLPFCFEGIIEAKINEEIKSGQQIRGGAEITPIVLTLLRKIDDRHIPLTVEGQKRLESLTHQMIDPAFIENKSLLLPSISSSLSNRFKAILRSPTVKAHNINALNNNKLSPNALSDAFSVSTKARFGKISMGPVRDAIATNPAECAKALAFPVVTTFMKGADEAAISETHEEVNQFINGLADGNAAQALSAKLNKFMAKFRILSATKVDLNISTQRAAGEVRQQIDDIRKKVAADGIVPNENDAENINLIAPLFVKGVNALVKAQKQRNQGLSHTDQSVIAKALPKISSKIGLIKSAVKLSSFLGGLSPVLKPILSIGIKHFAEDKIKKLQDELQQSVLEANTELQNDLVAQIEFFKYVQNHADAAANIAVNIIFPILKMHDLDKHDDLINYLVSIGNDPGKEIYPPELMNLLLGSADVLLDEINTNYKEIVPGLIDGLRSFQELA